MRNIIVLTSALALLATPTLAQQEGGEDSQTEMDAPVTAPRAGDPAAQTSGGVVPASPEGTTPAPATEMGQDTAQMDSENMAEPPEGVVRRQEDGQSLGANVIGSSVLNANGDSIGDINNLLIDKDNTVTAAVIGVGGFLGIGEKDVGLKMDQLTWDPQGLTFTTEVTQEQLEAAPNFQTLAARQAEEAAQQQTQSTTDTTVAPTAPVAPEDGTAPAQ